MNSTDRLPDCVTRGEGVQKCEKLAWRHLWMAPEGEGKRERQMLMGAIKMVSLLQFHYGYGGLEIIVQLMILCNSVIK